MMASNRRVLASAQPRMSKSKTNHQTKMLTHHHQTSRNFQKPPKLSALSPEARKAMRMVIGREDTKENMAANKMTPQENRDVSKRSANPQTTARSRSTLSHHETSLSNKNNNNRQYKPQVTSSSLSNNNHSNASLLENNLDLDDQTARDFDLDPSDLEKCEDSVEARSQSFVLTLDQALDAHGLCRLRGDITDKTPVGQTRVRALDGGRLTNAQEVVVNVCYEDDRELVFHDDDEESLDTARAASLIRVNVWMDYNDQFSSDDGEDEHEGFLGGKEVEVVEAEPQSRRGVSTARVERSKTFVQGKRNPLPKLPGVSASNSKENLRTQTRAGVRVGSSLSSASRKNSAGVIRGVKKL